MNASETFDRIENAYIRLGYRLNWGFLTCPQSKFDDPEVLLIGLNPGGDGDGNDPYWERQKLLSYEKGNYYQVADWEVGAGGVGSAPLQRQVQGMCKFLNIEIEDLASANFVPFQSPSWDKLPSRNEALTFARNLWTDVLKEMRPKLIIALGKVVGSQLAALLEVKALEEIDSNWGSTKIRFGETATGSRLVILPHLSYYKIFNADGSDNRYSPPLKQAFRLESGT